MIERRGDTWVQIRDVDGDDERFDVLFWQAQGAEAIFWAAWELVETAWEIKGYPKDELRLQRSPVVVQPAPRSVPRRRGYAVIYYTNPRYTKDLDAVVALTDEDKGRAADALKEFGFPLTESDVAELRTPNRIIVLGRPPSRIGVLNGIDGIDFDGAYAWHEMVTIRGEACPFLSLEDLIAAKKAAGRPQDRLDLKGLQRELKARDGTRG